MGPQIPLFEHMDGQAEGVRGGDGLGMDGPGIAVKHKVGDALLRDNLAEGFGPAIRLVLEGDVAGRGWPEGPVAAVEADPPDLRAGIGQHPPQTVKEGPMRSLQEQEAVSLGGAVHVCPFPPALVGVRPVKVKGKTCDFLTVSRAARRICGKSCP